MPVVSPTFKNISAFALLFTLMGCTHGPVGSESASVQPREPSSFTKSANPQQSGDIFALIAASYDQNDGVRFPVIGQRFDANGECGHDNISGGTWCNLKNSSAPQNPRVYALRDQNATKMLLLLKQIAGLPDFTTFSARCAKDDSGKALCQIESGY